MKASASSEFDGGYAAAKVADGVIGDKDGGDWASRGEREPWVQLDFPKPVKTDRIVIYDRPGTLDDVNGGELQFSDGSTVPVTGVPVDGTAKTVEFPLRTVEWVRFQVRGGTGQNPGLSELEVYALPSAPEPPAAVTVTRDRRPGEGGLDGAAVRRRGAGAQLRRAHVPRRRRSSPRRRSTGWRRRCRSPRATRSRWRRPTSPARVRSARS